MTDQKMLITALRQAAQILRDYAELGRRDADKRNTLEQLEAVLDAPDLARAVERLERGRGRE